MLPHATRRDDVAGNKQVYGGFGTCKPHASSASGSTSLLRVHGHPDKLHCLIYPDEVATLRMLSYHQRASGLLLSEIRRKEPA